MAASRINALLFGPELYWIFAYLVAHVLGARNSPSTPEGNALLERMWWLFPLIATPLSYLVYLAPNAGRWWLLARINVAAIIGLTFCLLRISSAIDYHDTRNSGLFAGFAIGLTVGFLVLAACDVAAALRLAFTRSR